MFTALLFAAGWDEWRNTVGLIVDMYVSANTIFKLVSTTVNTHKNTQNAKHRIHSWTCNCFLFYCQILVATPYKQGAIC